MKKVFTMVVVAVAAYAVAQSVILAAYGRGTIAVGDNVGTFGFNAAKSENRQFGSANFVEANRQGPVAAVAMPAAREVAFANGALSMTGPGYLMKDGRRVEVRVAVRATPTTRENKGTFAVSCSDANGNVVYGARGELTSGRNVFRRVTDH